LIGSIISGGIFHRFQKYKSEGTLEEKPVVSVVIEEAPRVLGAEVLTARGDNIYSTIAREGRKFKVGLIAITQLVSLIPRTILANMNTKIILGNELAAERQAVMESAAQDLSTDDRTIASLDKGEAIVSSNFTRFAVPIHIPLFEKYIEEGQEPKEKNKTVFVG
jgi:DNA helicase HerA-like ATPase